MLAQTLLPVLFLGALADAIGVSGLQKRATKVSTDGTCSSTVTCVGSTFGDCCSQYGYCGSTPDFCGTGSSSKVSQDGTCGNGVTCQGSVFGNCCSQYGYCGSTSNHCGTGCKSDSGTCGSSSGSSSASKSSGSTKGSTSPTSSRPSSSAVSTAPAATSTNCDVEPTQVVTNPSFEDGLSPWTVSGGSVLKTNGQDTSWYFTTNAGSKYIQMESSSASPNSTVTQKLSNIGFSTGTISFDWQYNVITTGRGPPSTDCTLITTFGIYTVASWTRPGSQGGKGHVETTFSMGIGAGDLTFQFYCTVTSYRAGVLLDNVRFTSSC